MYPRQLGPSSVHISPIILGTSQFSGMKWGPYEENDVVRTIHAALDAGITTIDTAPAYGVGRSEELVGKAVRGRRGDVVIATKCSLQWHSRIGKLEFHRGGVDVYRTLRPESVIRECEESLKRLGTEYIDLYQCHQEDPDTAPELTMGALVKLLEAGKIRAIGVSNHSVDRIMKMMKVGRLDSLQPQYNLLQRGIEEDALPFCRENRIGVIPYSPLAQGLLTGRVTMDRVFPESDFRHNHPYYVPEVRRQVLDALERVKPIARAHAASLAQIAVAWMIGEPGITGAICGAHEPAHAVENAKAAEIRLSPDERAAIRASFTSINLPR